MGGKRWVWMSVAGLLLLAAAAGLWALRDDFAYARIAAGYAAKQTCSCRHVSGRSLESCIADFPEDARARVSVTETNNRVRASVLFGAFKAEAEYEDGFGCRVRD